MSGDKGSIVIYYNKLQELEKVIKELKEDGINIIIESCEGLRTNLEASILDTLYECKPDLVLIDNDDFNNGLTLYKFIKEEGSKNNIPVIFVGAANKEIKLEALKLGAVDFIEKPFLNEELSIKCKNIIYMSKTIVKGYIYDLQTGTYSKKFGEELARKELKIIIGEKENYTILAVEIDNMAFLNEAVGKSIGNEIIKECVRIFANYIGNRDVLYRYSGQSFVMVFPKKTISEVYEISQTMQNNVKDLSKKLKQNISFTGGIACLNFAESELQNILVNSFESMQLAKREGKSRTYIHPASMKEKNKKSILIFDEDRVLLTILSSRYKNKGYEVFLVEDEDSLDKVLHDKSIDLVITEFILSGITGNELVKKLKSFNRNIKIIVLSSQRNENFIEMALNTGVDDYVAKPFSPIELDSRVRRLLEQ